MLRAATPVAQEQYYKGIQVLHEDYPTSWDEISLADELVRKEQWALMLDVGLTTRVLSRALSAGCTVGTVGASRGQALRAVRVHGATEPGGPPT